MDEKRGEERKDSEKRLFKEIYLKRCEYLLSKRILKEQEVYNMVRDFFKELLDIHYEFTGDELVSELNRMYLDEEMRKKIRLLLQDVFRIQYEDKSLSDGQLHAVLVEFKKLVNILVVDRPKRSVFQEVLHALKRKHEPSADVLEKEFPPVFDGRGSLDPKTDSMPAVESMPPSEKEGVEERSSEGTDQKEPEVQVKEEKPVLLDEKLAHPVVSDWTQDPLEQKSTGKMHIHKADANRPGKIMQRKGERTPKKNEEGKKAMGHPKFVSPNAVLPPPPLEKKDVMQKKGPKERMAELFLQIDAKIRDKDVVAAKQLYNEMHLIYKNLPDDVKKGFFQKVHDTYSALKTITPAS